MRQEIYIQGRGYNASATYDDGQIIVHQGSQINYPETHGFTINKTALMTRENKDYVKDGVVIKECGFESPSTAAQFITGGSRNGYDTWKVKKGMSLGAFLEENGVRTRRKNKNRKTN